MQPASCLHPNRPAMLAKGAKAGRSQVQELHRQAGKALRYTGWFKCKGTTSAGHCAFSTLGLPCFGLCRPSLVSTGWGFLGQVAPWPVRGFAKLDPPGRHTAAAGEGRLGAGDRRDGTGSRLVFSGPQGAWALRLVREHQEESHFSSCPKGKWLQLSRSEQQVMTDRGVVAAENPGFLEPKINSSPE